MAATLKKALAYYPVRYYAAAVLVFFVLLNSAELINDFQEIMISRMLNFLGVSASISNANLFVGEIPGDSRVILPTYLEMLFLGFFPVVALTARGSLVTRFKLIGFAVLCFLMFTMILLAAIYVMYMMQVLESILTVRMVTLGATIISGSMMIEFTLFSVVTIPKPTRLQRLFSRSYKAEYLALFIVLVSSGILVYSAVSYLGLDLQSPLSDYVLLALWLSISSMTTFAFFLANLAFEARRRVHLRKIERMQVAESPGPDRTQDAAMQTGQAQGQEAHPFSISFLIPAYNEEKLIGRCIKSIDRAAQNYHGKIETVIVNDGSTDRTAQVVRNAYRTLSNVKGRLFNIQNSGKGFAVSYGLKRTSGDIVFRTDADSEIDENALGPMMNHFKDPAVGSVCAWVFPLKGKSLLWRIQNLLCAYYLYTKRAQDVVDSIITQPGSSTAFRREALIKSGGWVENIFGEDGEITNRISRLGYRTIFEGRSTVYSEHPETLLGFLQQRARWGVAFYHSRGRNLRLLSEFHTPRSLVFFWNLVGHGAGLGKTLIWPFLVASILTGVFNLATLDEFSAAATLIVKLVAIQASIVAIQLSLYAYKLHKAHRLSDLAFFPFIRLVNLLLNLLVKPQVVDVLLHWSSKWKVYNDDSFRDLRKEVNKSIDPLYPSGEKPVPIVENRSTNTA
jgi:cellulose synthase/poly-beta-1,6-N-acetylglucosamine synthase-like glycosyltransferase